jgi:hypothetical protein
MHTNKEEKITQSKQEWEERGNKDKDKKTGKYFYVVSVSQSFRKSWASSWHIATERAKLVVYQSDRWASAGYNHFRQRKLMIILLEMWLIYL